MDSSTAPAIEIISQSFAGWDGKYYFFQFWRRGKVFKGAKNCPFFAASGPGGRELKTMRKELKAKTKGNDILGEEIKTYNQTVSIDFGAPDAPLTLASWGSLRLSERLCPVMRP